MPPPALYVRERCGAEIAALKRLLNAERRPISVVQEGCGECLEHHGRHRLNVPRPQAAAGPMHGEFDTEHGAPLRVSSGTSLAFLVKFIKGLGKVSYRWRAFASPTLLCFSVSGSAQLMLASKDVAVGSRAFDLLDLLVAARDSVVSRDEIMKFVWPDTLVGKTDHNVQVSKPRRVLEAAAFLAIPGRGLYLAVPAHNAL